MSNSLGDAAQTRKIIEQVVSAMDEDGSRKKDIDHAVATMKLWVLGGVILNFAPLMFAAVWFGSYTKAIDDSLSIVKQQQVVLSQRAVWSGSVEARIGGLEQWAEPQGYKPPKPATLPGDIGSGR